MTRSEIVRVLYVGGQAAIIAELVVVAGLILVAVAAPDTLTTQARTHDPYVNMEEIVEVYHDNSTVFVLGTGLMLITPTFIMLVVVWAWHLYFAAEGVRLMNWVATSIALMGAALMLAAFSLQSIGVGLVAQALEDGRISWGNAYMGEFMVFSFQRMAVALLYGFYPFMLVVASRQKRLLPMWFVVAAFFFASLNDFSIISSVQHEGFSNAIGIMLVLWPFFMGVVLLRKAQTLANKAYEEQHGTPPPQTSWLDGWRTTPPTVNPQTPPTQSTDETLPETQLLPRSKQQD